MTLEEMLAEVRAKRHGLEDELADLELEETVLIHKIIANRLSEDGGEVVDKKEEPKTFQDKIEEMIEENEETQRTITVVDETIVEPEYLGFEEELRKAVDSADEEEEPSDVVVEDNSEDETFIYDDEEDELLLD